MTLDMLLKTLVSSLKRPKEGISAVFKWQLSLQDSALALTLTAVVSAVLISLLIGPLPPEVDPVTAAMLGSPFYLAIVQLVGLAMIAACLHLLGRVFGGQGTLPQAVVMMAWLEVILILISTVQSVALILVPPVGVVLVPVGMVLSRWLITNFVAELHGVGSLVMTLLGVIAAFIAAVFAMIFAFFVLFVLGILHV